jgi:hypothetical protein
VRFYCCPEHRICPSDYRLFFGEAAAVLGHDKGSYVGKLNGLNYDVCFQGPAIGNNLSMVNVLSRVINTLNRSQTFQDESGVCGTVRVQ